MPDVVSNTGPIIALAQLGRLDLLRQLFGRILLPAAVHSEVLAETSRAALEAAGDWGVFRDVQNTVAVQILREELDAGESEAIILAGEIPADLLLIDERAATRKARSIGLRCIGTLGVLLLAKDKGWVDALKPLLDDLRLNGFCMGDALYAQVLQSAGEADN